MKLFSVCALSISLALSTHAAAQDAAQKKADTAPPKELPAPNELPPLPTILIKTAPGSQLGTRSIWQAHAVDSRGRFVHRVVMDGNGAYYLGNGQPYPWTTINSQIYMPYARD